MILENLIIKEASSELTQPIVIVSKMGSSEVRLCIDFRKESKLAKMDFHPFPRIKDLINKTVRARDISALGLSRDY